MQRGMLDKIDKAVLIKKIQQVHQENIKQTEKTS